MSRINEGQSKSVNHPRVPLPRGVGAVLRYGSTTLGFFIALVEGLTEAINEQTRVS